MVGEPSSKATQLLEELVTAGVQVDALGLLGGWTRAGRCVELGHSGIYSSGLQPSAVGCYVIPATACIPHALNLHRATGPACTLFALDCSRSHVL